MKIKKITALILTVVLALALCACGGNAPAEPSEPADPAQTPAQETEKTGDTYKLVFTTHLPETGIDGASLKAYLDDVVAACDGQLEIEYYFAGSMTKNAETLQAVSSGLADIAFVPEGFFAAELYPTNVATIPFTTTSEWVAGKAMNAMFENSDAFKKMTEDNNVVYIGSFVPSEVVLVSAEKPIETMDALKGLKVRAGGATAGYMNELGSSAVAIDASEIYENLNNGTVEAATAIPVTLACSYKLYEIADYFIFTGMGTYTTSSIYMNQDSWDALPENIQQAFKDCYNNKWIDEYSSDEWMGGSLKQAVADIEGAGKSVICFSEEEQAKCAEALASAKQTFIDGCAQYGYDGQEILDTYAAYVAEFEPQDIAYSVYDSID